MNNILEKYHELKKAYANEQKYEKKFNAARYKASILAKDLAILLCPFSLGDTILLPEYKHRAWQTRGIIVKISAPRLNNSVYSLTVKILGKTGRPTRGEEIIDSDPQLERMNNKKKSFTINEITKLACTEKKS